jgi:hypothetical protein
MRESVQPQVPARSPRGSTIARRLEFFSIPEPNSGCLLWLGRVRTNGYPQINVDGASRAAHRVALEQKLGRPLLPGEFACHKCDVKICINEDHLFPGSHADNMADMKAKRRAAHSYKPWTSPLTAAQVIAIRADKRLPYRLIAADYGINSRTVSDIKLGKRWAHLARPQ